ncbi:hypothetical protein [Dongia sp.]|uniref:hypothetical protein n=1 Tax=Dongia sp. TaxID=1977262 RepID=UPI0035AEFC77
MKLLIADAKRGNSADVAKMLVSINNDDAPRRDQDIVDFLSEFYLFVVFGYRPVEHPSGIKNWEDLSGRASELEQSSQHRSH